MRNIDACLYVRPSCCRVAGSARIASSARLGYPRFKLHFTPTSSSWINLVERLFAEITRQQIRRGVFKSVAELEAAIETWLTERNAKPKPFKWTAEANIILKKNARARRALEEDLAAGTK